MGKYKQKASVFWWHSIVVWCGSGWIVRSARWPLLRQTSKCQEFDSCWELSEKIVICYVLLLLTLGMVQHQRIFYNSVVV